MENNGTQYDQVFEHSSEGLVVCNQFGVIEAVNPRLILMLGYKSKEELIGEKIEVLVPNSVKSRHVSLREGYAKKPSVRTMGGDSKLTAKRKDNSEFPVEISLSHYKKGDETKIIAFVIDISRRVKAEDELNHLNEHLEQEVLTRTKELAAQNKLLQSVASHFPNGNIYVLGKNFEIEWADGKLLRNTGLTDESLNGLSFIERLPDDLKRKIELQLKEVYNGQPMDSEVINNQRHYSLYAVPLDDEIKKTSRILLVELDITEAKELELEMVRNLEKEKELNEMKSRFVSMASHEFRTPLSSIVSSATLIGKYVEGDQQAKRDKHISRIKRSVSNLMIILNDFLSIDKMDEGKTGLNLEKVNVEELGQEIIEEISVLKKSGQVVHYKHIGGGNEVFSDSKLLKNIILNLVSNAGKYSSENGEITLNTIIDSEALTIIVEDNGMGIPLDEQDQLFNRFFRAKNAVNIQGTGLGLNIVKKYVSLFNGTIEFESELNKGTIFTIQLPINQ